MAGRIPITRLKKMFGSWSKPCSEGPLSEAVEELCLLVQAGSFVNHSVIYGLLKRCIVQKDVTLGSRVHALAVKCGYESNAFLASNIIGMYASHGRLVAALNVFNKVPAPSQYMWSSIILAHARHGKPTQALKLYRQMRESASKPNSHTFVAALKACATAEDLAAGKEVHADIIWTGDQPNIFVGNCLVDMYAKCGSLQDARRVFNGLPIKDVVTWNCMIAGYAQHGLGQAALTLYDSMQQEGVTSPNRVTFLGLLQACASIRALDDGKQLHAELQERGLGSDMVIGNCLVDMYAKCRSLGDARRVFDNMPARDVVTWNAMIAGYTQNGLSQEAFTLYASMQQQGTILANPVTFASLLRACTSVGSLHQGKQLHEQIQERGLLHDVVVGNCLVDMYSKCGSVEDARRVFENLPVRDVVTWTAMIGGYAQHGLGQEALALYGKMQEGKTPANEVTFVCLLQACAGIGALPQGKELHAQIQERGLVCNVIVGTCLVDMYLKCKCIDSARNVFDSLPSKNAVTWNVMISGYAQSGLGQEALALYECMQQEGTTIADPVTYMWLLQSCGSVAGLEKGREIHALISEVDLERTHLAVANSLINMYGKCGSMGDAHQVFSGLPMKDIVTWNALIAGHARQGDSEAVFDLFQTIRQEGLQPNGLTFLSLLTVCSHVGLVDEGQKYFDAMSRNYGITPTIEHYNCMVDLHARAGHVARAVEMLKTMPFQPHSDMVRTVLGACQKWSNVELGRQAFECALRLDKSDATTYVLMSNIYAANGLQEEAKQILAMRVKERAWKKPGQSWWTDTSGIVHTFVADDREQPESQQIYSNLTGVHVKLKEDGYLTNLHLSWEMYPG